MADVFLSLGSNIGERADNVRQAIARLEAVPGLAITGVSSAYRTVPVGPVEQDWFLNLALRAETPIPPQDLMAICLTIEAELGRDRAHSVRWGPRLIDIDMILYGDLSLETPSLHLPHPRFKERAFVLVPMAELAPERMVEGQTFATLAAQLDVSGVKRLDEV